MTDADESDDTPRVPAPRSPMDPLPRRTRSTARSDDRHREETDEETLHRLLSGLREI